MHKGSLSFFTFGFVAVGDTDWKNQGVWMVYVDFETCEVTGFRVGEGDFGAAANTLRDDEDGAREVKEMYEMDA